MTIIETIQRRLRRQRAVAAGVITVAVSLSVALTVFSVVGDSVMTSAFAGLAVFLLLCFIYYKSGSFSLPPDQVVVRFLDREFPLFEDSSGLYLKSDLNPLERLQLQRIEANRAVSNEQIRLPKKRLIRSLSLSAFLLIFVSVFTLVSGDEPGLPIADGDGSVVAQGVGVTEADVESAQPAIESVVLTVIPPPYTGLPERTETGGSVSVAAGSGITWTVNTSGNVEEAALMFNDRDLVQLQPQSGSSTFSARITAENRLIYRVMAASGDTTVYSNYFSVDVRSDNPPQFRVSSPGQFRSLLTEANRKVVMQVEIRDDYGVTDAGLNATLARGSGESVRFREQQIAFDEISGIGTNSVSASILLHADSLGMTPGDELYLYATATDDHPDGQTGRSETFMIVVEDTTRTQPLLAGNIQIDLMPEDFRSQRQIIVDTEELIAEKESISEEQFRIRSRRIGRDQEMLMLDFGQYMSMENESPAAPAGMPEGMAEESGHDHDHGGDDGHDHGAETGQAAELDGEGQETTRSTAASAIPEEFFHDHGSPEMNTLFAESPRALLRRALNEMFQASRYLLTDQPEEAMAYEYRALEFLQEAQQADRRYVRRAGLDGIPIPVDEERFTGEIDDFANPQQSYRSDRQLPPLVRLERQLRENQQIEDDMLQTVSETINQATIPERDKLYLLNRLNRLQRQEDQTVARQELLSKLSDINANRQRYPSPIRIPALNNRRTDR